MKWYYRLKDGAVLIHVYTKGGFTGKLTFKLEDFKAIYQAFNGGKSPIVFVNEELDDTILIT